MSEEDLIMVHAVSAAEARRPHRKWILAGLVVAAVLSIVAVSALALGVHNISAQNASVACQGSLLSNVSAQNAAGKDARVQLQKAGQVLADATQAQSADIAVLLDPAADRDARSAAVQDFQHQGVLISDAWHTYVASSVQADRDRDASPTTFRC